MRSPITPLPSLLCLAALPGALEVKANTPPAMVGYMLSSQALGKATLAATFTTP